MKIKESKKMSNADVLQFFNTLTLIGTSMSGPKDESDVALTAFYSLIISRSSVVHPRPRSYWAREIYAHP